MVVWTNTCIVRNCIMDNQWCKWKRMKFTSNTMDIEVLLWEMVQELAMENAQCQIAMVFSAGEMKRKTYIH